LKKDIQHIEDIKLLVNTFYSRVRENDMLGPIFDKVIGDKWPEHLEKMYRFWQSILLHENTYSGRPFPPHAKLPVGKEHFDTWQKLFISTVDNLFEGSNADEAKKRAILMAAIFHSKKEAIDKNRNQSLFDK
jgi:hemoglobin